MLTVELVMRYVFRKCWYVVIFFFRAQSYYMNAWWEGYFGQCLSPKLLERILIRFGIGDTHILVSLSIGRLMESLSKFPLTCILEFPGSNVSGIIGFSYGEFCIVHSLSGSRYSYWLRSRRPRGRSSSPIRVKHFLHVVQTDCGPHPAS
jgi:hypothetical protein